MGLDEGGAAGMLDTPADPPAAGAAPAGGAPPAVPAPAAPAAAPAAGAGADWLAALSTETADGVDSNADWIKAKGFKDLDTVVKGYREAEKLISGKGAAIKPKEGASDVEIAAWNRAIGVPEKAEDYAVDGVPDGMELDSSFIDPLRSVALKSGVPAEGFKALSAAFVAHQLDLVQQERTKQDGLRDKALADWGADKDANLALARRGALAFGLTGDDMKAIQRGMGSDRMLDLALKLGRIGSEDTLIDGGKQKFGMSAAEAQAEIDRIVKDPVDGKRVKTDPVMKARWQRLNAAVAFETDRVRAQAAAG